LDRVLYQRYKRRSENEEKADFAGFSRGTIWKPSASEGRATLLLDRIGTTDMVGPLNRELWVWGPSFCIRQRGA
jgi:hypothetical protein